ncbi:hypothetical protein JB92DRAFT_2836167 [Gautieria morchelliformis]|nr:hypothetical protein JB92DRAFT_2836167 [Gautieria morchelliformis]
MYGVGTGEDTVQSMNAGCAGSWQYAEDYRLRWNYVEQQQWYATEKQRLRRWMYKQGLGLCCAEWVRAGEESAALWTAANSVWKTILDQKGMGTMEMDGQEADMNIEIEVWSGWVPERGGMPGASPDHKIWRLRGRRGLRVERSGLGASGHVPETNVHPWKWVLSSALSWNELERGCGDEQGWAAFLDLCAVQKSLETYGESLEKSARRCGPVGRLNLPLSELAGGCTSPVASTVLTASAWHGTPRTTSGRCQGYGDVLPNVPLGVLRVRRSMTGVPAMCGTMGMGQLPLKRRWV